MAKVRMSGQERREQLIGVGRGVFAERGYDAASVEEIADRAGVTKPVVYEHFGGKEGLYAVIVDREVQSLLDRIVTALETAEHPRRAVRGAAEAFLGYVEDERDGFRILVRDAPMGISSGTLPSVMGEVAARAESLLAEQFETRGLETAMAPLYAQALVGMVALAGLWWLDEGEPDRKVVVEHVVDLAWRGLSGLGEDTRGR